MDNKLITFFILIGVYGYVHSKPFERHDGHIPDKERFGYRHINYRENTNAKSLRLNDDGHNIKIKTIRPIKPCALHHGDCSEEALQVVYELETRRRFGDDTDFLINKRDHSATVKPEVTTTIAIVTPTKPKETTTKTDATATTANVPAEISLITKSEITANVAVKSITKTDDLSTKTNLEETDIDREETESDKVKSTTKTDITTAQANATTLNTDQTNIVTTKSNLATNAADITTTMADTTRTELTTTKSCIATNATDLSSTKKDIRTNTDISVLTGTNSITTTEADLIDIKDDVATDVIETETKTITKQDVAQDDLPTVKRNAKTSKKN